MRASGTTGVTKARDVEGQRERWVRLLFLFGTSTLKLGRRELHWEKITTSKESWLSRNRERLLLRARVRPGLGAQADAAFWEPARTVEAQRPRSISVPGEGKKRKKGEKRLLRIFVSVREGEFGPGKRGEKKKESSKRRLGAGAGCAAAFAHPSRPAHSGSHAVRVSLSRSAQTSPHILK